jgi:hypothetical protein
MTLDELNGIEITGEQFEKLTGYEEYLVKASRHGFIPNRVMSELQVIYDGITGVNTKRNGCCSSSAFVRIMYRWYVKYQAQPKAVAPEEPSIDILLKSNTDLFGLHIGDMVTLTATASVVPKGAKLKETEWIIKNSNMARIVESDDTHAVIEAIGEGSGHVAALMDFADSRYGGGAVYCLDMSVWRHDSDFESEDTELAPVMPFESTVEEIEDEEPVVPEPAPAEPDEIVYAAEQPVDEPKVKRKRKPKAAKTSAVTEPQPDGQ